MAAKTAILVHKVPRTTVGQWKLDLETLLERPLDQRLQPRHANAPYVALFDYSLDGWQEEMLTHSPPCAYVYLNPFFYTTDKQGRLEVLGPFSLEAIPLEKWASRFQQVTEIALETKIIPLQESHASPNIEALWRSYQPSRN